MQCEQFEQILEQQDAGALPPAALAHLEGCDGCRALSADFTAIRDAALELGAEEIAPPERVWISLRNQLEAEGLIHEPEETPQPVADQRGGGGPSFNDPLLLALFWRRAGRGVPWSVTSPISRLTTVDSQLKIQQEASPASRRGQRFQGRSPDRWKRIDSGPAARRHRGDQFHPPTTCKLLTTLSRCVKRAYANNLTTRWRGNICTGPISRRRNCWPRPRTAA